MIKGIIFDYGGTIDSRGIHWSEIIYDGWEACGVAADKETFREAYVYAERELARVRHILPEHTFGDLMRIKVTVELQWLAQNRGFAPQEIENKAEAIADYCDAWARQCVAAAEPVLRNLAREYPMVLVSNFYGNIESVLKEYGILDCFRQIIESSVVGVRKPDPQIFRLGVEALGLSPEETVVVGDSITKDIIPAQSIGCRTIWLEGVGWEGDMPEVPEGTTTIRSLNQLETLLLLN